MTKPEPYHGARARAVALVYREVSRKAVWAAFADGRGREGPGTICSPQANPPQAEDTPRTWHTACLGTHATVVTTRLLIPDSSLGILGKLHCGILSLAGEHPP